MKQKKEKIVINNFSKMHYLRKRFLLLAKLLLQSTYSSLGSGCWQYKPALKHTFRKTN